MFILILQLLEQGLELWVFKEKHKYVDKLMTLKTAYRLEWNKPEGERSRAALDNLEFEIENLAVAFLVESGGKRAS